MNSIRTPKLIELNISVNLFFEYEAISLRQTNITPIELDEIML